MNVMGIPLPVAVPSERELAKYQEQDCTLEDLLIFQVSELNATFPNNPYQLLCKAMDPVRDSYWLLGKTDCEATRRIRGEVEASCVRKYRSFVHIFDGRLWGNDHIVRVDRTLSVADFREMLNRTIYYIDGKSDLPKCDQLLGLPYNVSPSTGDTSADDMLDQSFVFVVDWFKAWFSYLQIDAVSMMCDSFSSNVKYDDRYVKSFIGHYLLGIKEPEPDPEAEPVEEIRTDAEVPEVENQPQEPVIQQEEEEVLDPVVYPDGIHMLETMSGQEQQFFRVKAEATVNFSMQFSFTEHYLKQYVDTFNATLAPAGVTVRATGANFACVEFDRLEVCDGYPTAESMNFESIKEKAALVDMIYKILVDMHRRNRLYKQVVATGKTQLLDGAQKG
jgi:hypothetical protein